MKRLRKILPAAATAVTACGASAQPAYPTKPVRIIVNFATGGPSDIVARMLSLKDSGARPE